MKSAAKVTKGSSKWGKGEMRVTKVPIAIGRETRGKEVRESG